jgi:tetratricopeptide (TPR) repeat protein
LGWWVLTTEDSAESWLMKGDEFSRQDKYEEALDCYLNATDINPEFADAWHKIGVICQILGQNEEADACFEKERIAIQRSTGNSSSNSESEIKEEIIVERPEQPNEDNAEDLYQKGIKQSQRGQLDEALSTFEQLLLSDPSDYRVWNSKGITLAKLRRYQEADDAFKQSLMLNPSYQPAVNNQNKVRNILSVPEPVKQDQSHESSETPETIIQSTVLSKKKSFCPECHSELSAEETEICLTCGAGVQGVPPVTGEKSPGIAALLSFFLPGLGQVYNGDFTRGLLFLVVTCIGIFLLVIPGVIVWIYQVYDAYSTAKKMNTGEIPFKKAKTVHIILFIVVFIVAVAIVIMVAAAIAAFVFGMA